MGWRLTSLLTLLCTVACNTSSGGTDHAKAREEMRAQNEWDQQTATLVPPPGAVGCEACPYWCAVYDLHPLPVSERVPRYRQAAIEHLRVERYGRAWEQLEAMACMVKAGHDELWVSWRRLLHDPDEAVRYSAAVHAIQHELAVERGVAVLRHLVRDSSALGMDANVQLLRWNGDLPVEL